MIGHEPINLKEAEAMTVFVTIHTFQGAIKDVCIFLTEESARRKERQWRRQHSIKGKGTRRRMAKDGTEFTVLECNLEP